MAKFFNIQAPPELTEILKFEEYVGWVNPDNKKPIEQRTEFLKKAEIYHDCTGDPGDKSIAKYFKRQYVYRLNNCGFKLICNQQTYINFKLSPLKPEVIECINAYVKYITGHDYDIMNTIYGKQYTEYTESTGNILSYQIWVSPDNGFILVDHIMEYPADAVSRAQFFGPHFSVNTVPISMARCALIFTGLKAYDVSEKNFNKIISRQNYIDTEFKFIWDFEQYQYLDIMYNYSHTACRHSIMHDKTDHIWYSTTIWHYRPCDISESEYNSAVVPEDLTKIPKRIIKHYTSLNKSLTDNMVCCMSHPKIKGFKYKWNCGFIVYVTNDPEFCEKLLGPGSADYIKSYCDMCARASDNQVMKLYTFIWYDDNLMKVYDKFMDNIGKDVQESCNDILIKHNIESASHYIQ